MSFTTADVVKLRKVTGAGMMDCKGALADADGNFERAVEIIREKGKLVAN
jgi:elongation factor Ts